MSISGLIAGGGIPKGDQLRVASPVTLNNGSATTILTESGGTGGIFWGFYLEGNNTGATLSSVAVIVDGASERTYNYGISGLLTSNGNVMEYVSLPIKYESSLTVKVYSSRSGGSSISARGISYSLNN